MHTVSIIFLPFLLGLSGGQLEGPKCTFGLFLPGGCLDSTGQALDYSVANFSFFSGSDLAIKPPDPDDPEFCQKGDIWTTQDDSCAIINESRSFSKDIKCPQKNLIVLSGGAVFHPDAKYRSVGERTQPRDIEFGADSRGKKYSTRSAHCVRLGPAHLLGALKPERSGLLIHCEAADPLNITIDLDGLWPYLGFSVTFGHFQLDLKDDIRIPKILPQRNSEENIPRRFWLKAKIPPKFSGKEGNIQKYAGNYTVFSVSNPNSRETFQLQVKEGDDEIKQPVSSPCGGAEVDFLEICGLSAFCTSPNITGPGVNMYFANIVGFNPTETRILKKCLEKDSLCEGKILGELCLDKPGCKLFEKIYPNGAIRCDDGQTVEDIFYFHGLDFRPYKSFSGLPPQSVIKLKLDDNKNITTFAEIEGEEADADFQNKTIPVYEKEPKGFKCQFIPYVLLRPIDWIVTFVNESESLIHQSTAGEEEVEVVELDGTKLELEFLSVSVNVNMTKDIRSLECRASFWNSVEFVYSNIISFNVQESSPPIFLTSKRPAEKVEFGQKFSISCGNVTGQPEPTFTWKINNVVVNKTDPCINTNGKNIDICAGAPEHNGKFTCAASNFLSSAFQEIQVKVEKSGTDAWIYFGVACGIILILIPILLLLFRVYSRTRARLSYFEIEAFEKGNIKELKSDNFAHENVQFLPYNKDYEIPSSSFEIDEDQVLGRGAYGVVMKAKLYGNTTAAVKTVLPDADKATVLSLLSELKIMIYLGKHSYVIELLGANTEQLKNGCPYLFVEFCKLGNLESFIKKHREDFIARRRRGQDSGLSYANVQPDRSGRVEVGDDEDNNKKGLMSTDSFFRWSIQIADGMAYLQEKKVIHGDLAIRNVLLSSVEHVKITDFGLSRQLMNTSAYVKKQQQLLPWRNMALESLQSLIFTSKSDVWSFGVTMYEIFSLGQIPYGGMSWTVEFVEKLEADLRLPMPAYGNLELYGVMLECWNPDPECRPDFSLLRVKLETLLNQLLTNVNETQVKHD